ncbi:SPW repeat protein [Streptomyces sp. NPDC001848]|uniref:SPW repeat protein n=1 Tax=Streptomyces sp. NPDC001848 TaxID=3364618 RepID=UPI00369E79DA
MARHTTGMTTHPDLAEMRERLERTASSGSAVVLGGLVLPAGLYAAISPWVVHFSGAPFIAVNNLIVGLAVALIGFCSALAPERMLRPAWVVAPLGLWLVISPWVVTATHGARAGIVWNNCWIGAVTAALGLAAMGLTVGVTRRRIPR